MNEKNIAGKINYLKTLPLEVKKRQEKSFEASDYECFALVGKEKKDIETYIRVIYKKAISCFGRAFAVIWFYDNGISKEVFLEQFDTLTLKFQSNECLIYELYNYEDIEKILVLWGEFDILDILFPINIGEYTREINDGFYCNYNKYRKDYLSWVKNMGLVISDSGDGEEVQVVYRKDFRNELNDSLCIIDEGNYENI